MNIIYKTESNPFQREIERRSSSLHILVIEFGCCERQFLSRCQINGIRRRNKSQPRIGNKCQDSPTTKCRIRICRGKPRRHITGMRIHDYIRPRPTHEKMRSIKTRRIL